MWQRASPAPTEGPDCLGNEFKYRSQTRPRTVASGISLGRSGARGVQGASKGPDETNFAATTATPSLPSSAVHRRSEVNML